MIRFIVHGTPKALKRHRTGKFGNYDPSKLDKETFLILAHKHRPSKPLDCPIKLSLTFQFPRPKSHFGTGKNSERLKDNAPYWHTSTPDTDNLVKMVADALNGVYWKDDSCICDISAIKMYSQSPKTIVVIEEIRTEPFVINLIGEQ